ncbi:hypothetical protein C8Q73DRAFT_645718, partial [Cubamyces lactineus]
MLSGHVCVTNCLCFTYVFQMLSKPRPLRARETLMPSRNAGISPSPTVPVSAELHSPSEIGPENIEDGHLQIADHVLRRTIIEEWQASTSTVTLQHLVCAVCARSMPAEYVTVEKPSRIDFTLLRNDALPPHVRPTSYNLEAYDGAILNPKGLKNTNVQGEIQVCRECRRDLRSGRMPLFALANWLYYGHDRLPLEVRQAFRESTHAERLLVARARASTISVRFSELKGHVMHNTAHAGSQKCVKGNVAIHPQDAARLTEVLPPGRDAIRDTLCAVFVGENKPTMENIKKLKPIVVRKSRVRTMIDFLVENNPLYSLTDTFKGYSQSNMDGLFGDGTAHIDIGVPCSIEIGHIPSNSAVSAATADYVPNQDDGPRESGDDFLMDTVGYTDNDDSPVSERDMRMVALSHCLDGRRFVQSQAGSRFIPDFENEDLLTLLFPHLDPWNIGGFHDKRRGRRLSLEQQLKYLLTVDGSPFREDPDFAFVFYNIRQKRTVLDSVTFRVPASQRDDVIRQLMRVNVNQLNTLIDKFRRNPRYKPQTDDESTLMRVLARVNAVSPSLPGSNGYKIRLRNQIRGLINYLGTPTFFITLNPSDRDHPLVEWYAGHAIDPAERMKGVELSRWKRTCFAARNPTACAQFFDKMISSFISVILRFGKSGRGLFG